MITMSALPAIIKATILREYRSKTIFFMLGLTVLSLFLVNMFLGLFAPSADDGGEFNLMSAYILSFFIVLMNWWCVLISTIIGSNSFAGDQENGLIGTILSFPITRETYVIGRFIGISIIILLLYVVSYGLAIATFSYHAKSLIVGPELFHSLIYLGLTIWGVVIFSGLLGLIMPRVFAAITMIVTNGIYGQIVSTQFQTQKIETFSDGFISIAAYIFPRIGIMGDMSSYVINKTAIPYNLAIEIPHFILTSFFWVMVISLVVKKKDF